MKRVVKTIKTEGKKSSHGLTVMQEYNNLNMFYNKFNVVKFQNHGFYPKSNFLKQEDLLFKYEATMYLELLKDIKTENLNLLDIGCGRGGGINVLKKYLKLKEANGCDINSMAIDYCEENYKDIDFKICSSEKLTYENEYFDLITNVESFHLYENKEKFFKEASRVLKTNGHLLMTDINLNYTLGDSFKDYFEVIDIIDITHNVAFACKHNIKHFNKNIKNEEMKNHLLDLSKHKFDSYLKDNTYYIVKLIKKKIKKIMELFPIPLHTEELNLNVKAMAKYCLAMKKKVKSYNVSNRGGWQSPRLTGKHPPLNDLFKEILRVGGDYQKIIAYKDPLKILSLWVNINGHRDHNISHIHPSTVIAGSFYLKPTNSAIVFENPCLSIMEYDWAPCFLTEYNRYNSGAWTINPTANQLLMFPGWLRHRVEPNLGKDYRISISFNLGR